MNPDPRLAEALAEAVVAVLPADVQPFSIGDHISVVEILHESGSGTVILAESTASRHMALLANALAQIIDMAIYEPTARESKMEGDADAA